MPDLKKIKICVIHFRPPIGGTHTTLINQLLLLKKIEEFDIYFIGEDYALMSEIFKDNNDKYLKIKFIDKSIYTFFNFNFISKIRNFFKKNSFDFIYIFGAPRDFKFLKFISYGFKFKKLLRIDAFAWKKRVNIVDAFFFKSVDKWITVCNSIKQHILEYFPVKNEDKIQILYNFIDTDLYKKQNDSDIIKNKYNIPKNNLIISQCTRIVEGKGQLETVNAFAELSKKYNDIFLIITGNVESESLINNINEIIKINNLKNILIIKENMDVKEILEISDIYIFPTYTETISMAIMEAMSYELPVICSDVGGMNECIESDVNGILIDKQNHKQLCAALEKLIISKDLRIKLGANARKTIEQKFSEKKMLAEYKSFFLEYKKYD